MKKNKAHKLPHDQSPICPTCETPLSGFTAVKDGTMPTDGDISICVYCNAVNQFVIKGTLIKLVEIDPDVLERLDFPQLQKANKIVAGFRERYKGKK